MLWIKRNLFFVLSILAGLLLTGFAFYLLFSTLSDNAGVRDEFTSAVNDLKSLQSKTPFPSQDNIQAVQEQQVDIKKFLGEFGKEFVPLPPAPTTDQKGFKTYLEESIFHLTTDATNAGVQLPPAYAFSFSAQVGKLTYPPESIEPWMQQLVEIKAICAILFQAKINALKGLQRVAVSTDDTGTADYFSGAAIVTNQLGVVSPYKVMFRGFSPEIAAVLEGFAKSSNCFVVKDIDVVPSTDVMPATGTESAPPYAQPGFTAPPPMRLPPNRFAERSEGGRPFAPPQQPSMAGVRPAAVFTPPVTILQERPLFVTIAVDAIKLKTADH